MVSTLSASLRRGLLDEPLGHKGRGYREDLRGIRWAASRRWRKPSSPTGDDSEANQVDHQLLPQSTDPKADQLANPYTSSAMPMRSS